MFKTNISGHNKIWEGTKILGVHCSRMHPVAADLVVIDCRDGFKHERRKEFDADPKLKHIC